MCQGGPPSKSKSPLRLEQQSRERIARGSIHTWPYNGFPSRSLCLCLKFELHQFVFSKISCSPRHDTQTHDDSFIIVCLRRKARQAKHYTTADSLVFKYTLYFICCVQFFFFSPFVNYLRTLTTYIYLLSRKHFIFQHSHCFQKTSKLFQSFQLSQQKLYQLRCHSPPTISLSSLSDLQKQHPPSAKRSIIRELRIESRRKRAAALKPPPSVPPPTSSSSSRSSLGPPPHSITSSRCKNRTLAASLEGRRPIRESRPYLFQRCSQESRAVQGARDPRDTSYTTSPAAAAGCKGPTRVH